MLFKPAEWAILNYKLSLYKILVKIILVIIRIIARIEIGFGAKIGRNFKIIHGAGIVIIKDNVTLLNGVTLGGDFLVPVVIGENSIVGANMVVTKNFPEGSLIIGNPARSVKKSKRNSDVILGENK